MILYFICFLLSLTISFITLKIFIPILNKIKIGQPIYEYVKLHEDKKGTPTMGGLLFLIPAIIVSLIFTGIKNNVALFILSIGFSYMTVGFLDDFLKIYKKENEGLKPFQKIIFQVAIALLCAFFCYKNNLLYLTVPFGNKLIYLGLWGTILVVFIFLAITNSVNLTDGLDGLSSTVCITYLLFLSLIIFFEYKKLSFFTIDFANSFIFISISLIGALMSFLIFNFNKASVFMGDTGSLSLGGFIGALSIFSFNTFYIPIIGLMFVVSSISVIVQVIHYKRTKKRVFLMAPFHHHLQMKGLTEGKICYLYFLITFILGLVSLLSIV